MERCSTRLSGSGSVVSWRTVQVGEERIYPFWFLVVVMALSIKNVEAERLARELARERGTTLTNALIIALDDALRRERRRRITPSVHAAILEISERCAALPDLDDRTADEILGYDERGGFR